jgi:hypothetical protein
MKKSEAALAKTEAIGGGASSASVKAWRRRRKQRQ